MRTARRLVVRFSYVGVKSALQHTHALDPQTSYPPAVAGQLVCLPVPAEAAECLDWSFRSGAELGVNFAKDEGARFTNRARLVPLVGAAIAGRDAAELATVFDEVSVCWSRYQMLAQAVAEYDRLFRQNPLFATITFDCPLIRPLWASPFELGMLTRSKRRKRNSSAR